MTTSEQPTVDSEGRHHTYSGHVIPWFVRVMWILFWCFAITYAVKYLLPALQLELLAPP
jgi:hypothetical protein